VKGARGFTLLEVLIALIIVAGTIIAAGSLWSGNFNRIRKANLQYDVATLLERKMVEIEAKYSTKPLTEIPESENGSFGTDYPSYSWTMVSRDLELPDMTAVLMAQQENTDETLISMIKQMTDFLSKAIKEVKVTIVVKRRGRELKYSATQYFLDYQKEFGGGAAGGAPATPTTPKAPGT